VQVPALTPPQTLVEKIIEWKNSKKPAHFLITGSLINMFCTIEDFPFFEQGGDVGTIHFSLTLKEYRELTTRQIEIDIPTQTASLPPETEARPDNRVLPRTHTVVKGDNLWKLAKKYLGAGKRYKEIYALNRDIIKNPSLIRIGWVLRIPES